MKEGICTAVGVVGSAIAAAFGGWDQALVTLVIFIQCVVKPLASAMGI